MKKTKFILTCVVILLVASTALAFRTKNAKSFYLYRLDANGNCQEQFLGTPDNISPYMAYANHPTMGACPLSGRVKTPQ